jgi:hypothetical protein
MNLHRGYNGGIEFLRFITKDKEMNMKKYLDPHVTRSKKARVHNPNPTGDSDVQKGIDAYEKQRREERERQEKAQAEWEKQREEQRRQEQERQDKIKNRYGAEYLDDQLKKK